LGTSRASALLILIFTILIPSLYPLPISHSITPESPSASPVVPLSGAEFLSSDPTKWPIDTCKAVDTTDESGVGALYRDILAVYYYEATSNLYFRVDFLNLSSGYAPDLNVYIAINFSSGGQTWLPDYIWDHEVRGYEWELCAAIYDSSNAKLYNKTWGVIGGLQWKFHDFQGMLACNISKSTAYTYGYSDGATVHIRVATTKDGESGLKDICPNDNLGDGYWDGAISSAGSTITTKVAFVHHGNQHTNPFVGGVINDGAGHGFNRTLQSHENYKLPVNIHISGTLLAALNWSIPSFLTRVKNDVSNGLIEMVGSVYGQHIMPYLDEALNIWALQESRKMNKFFFGATPNVSWVPERVWKNFIADDFTASGYKAVILDGKWHHNRVGGPSPWCSCGNYHLTHRISASVTLYAFFIDERWYGEYLPRINVDLDYKRHWAGINTAGNEKQICVLGDDWEKTAGVAGWPNVNPDRYDAMIRWLAGAKPWIQLVKFSDYLKWYAQPTSGITFEIANQAPDWGSWPDGNYDTWYDDFKNWKPYGSTKTAEANWKNVLSALGYQSSFNTSTPAGRLRDLAMLILAANLYETGWHGWNGSAWVLEGWGKEMWSHLRYAMMPAKAANWVENLPTGPQAYWSDVDDDGHDELVMCNEKIFMVFENIGGRIVFIATSDGYVELGNFMVQYRGTEGDYNDDDHVGALTDKWYTYGAGHDYSHDSYTIEIEETTSSYVQAKLTSWDGNITKRVRLENGSHGFRATYDLQHASTLYVRLGSLCPGVKNLLYYGQPALKQMGSSGQGYMGWRNKNTNTSAAGAWQYPGAEYSWSWTLTVAKMFEIKSGSGKTNFQFDMIFGPLNLGGNQGISELSLITPYMVHLDVNSTFSVGTRLVVMFYNTYGVYQANKTVWTGVTPNHVILSVDVSHPLGLPIENATLVLTDNLGSILQKVTSLSVPRYAQFSLVDPYTVHLDLDYTFYEGSNLTVIFYSYFGVYQANTTVWSGTTPARVQLSINITHPLSLRVENATLGLTYANGTIIQTVTTFLAPPWVGFSLVTLYIVHLDVNGSFFEGSNLTVIFYSYSGTYQANTTVWNGATPANVTLSLNVSHPLGLPVERADLVLTDEFGTTLETVASFLVRRYHLFGRVTRISMDWPSASSSKRITLFRELVHISKQWPYASM